jgi:hypothetical protein
VVQRTSTPPLVSDASVGFSFWPFGSWVVRRAIAGAFADHGALPNSALRHNRMFRKGASDPLPDIALIASASLYRPYHL